jgi:hypothetical protein
MHTRKVVLGALMFASVAAFAKPPTQLAILRACGDADTPAQCERVIEADQIRQFPEVASRMGGVLRLKGKTGSIELRDNGTPGTDDDRPGFRAYAFWDYWFLRNAAVVSVASGAGDHYLVVDLNRGTQTKLIAEPVQSHDGSRFLVVDMCETRCSNTIEVWRHDRDRIYRERWYRPKEKWYEADVRWKDADALEVEYSVAVGSVPAEGEAGPQLSRERTRLLRFSDRSWTLDETGR